MDTIEYLKIINIILEILFALRIIKFKKDAFLWYILSLSITIFLFFTYHSNVEMKNYLGIIVSIVLLSFFIMYGKNKTLPKKLDINAIIILFVLIIPSTLYVYFTNFYEIRYTIFPNINTTLYYATISITISCGIIAPIILAQGYIFGFLLMFLFHLTSFIILMNIHVTKYNSDFIYTELLRSTVLLIIFSVGYIKNRKYLINP